jgi:purine-binding chemotaxis protein CheW
MAVRRNVARRQVDWAEVRSRLEAVGRTLSGATSTAPEQVRAVLEERARALARPLRTPAPIDDLEAITFALANERYAIESRYVFEVFRLEDLSPLPGAKPPVFGVTAWRGELLTILDLRTVLGLRVTALNDLSRVLVLGTDRPAFGILADAVHDVVRLSGSEVRQPPEGVAANREYLRGVTTNAVLVLDAEQVLRL